jgi:hypothetical protein
MLLFEVGMGTTKRTEDAEDVCTLHVVQKGVVS